MISDRSHREKYVNALACEMQMKKTLLENVETVYLGGGTPGYLEEDLMLIVLESIRDVTHKNVFKEFTLETNLIDITPENARLWKQGGINRISVGVETFSLDLLKSIGRTGGYQMAKSALETLRRAGFDNINFDMIYGLPGETTELVEKDIASIGKLRPDHVSWYSLILEKKTRLYHDVMAGIVKLPEDDLVYDMSDMVIDGLENLGYNRYEISNFSHPGKESLHNTSCWNLEEYLGVGLGACSQYDSKRFRNISGWKGYIEAVLDGKGILTTEEMFEFELERVMLGLRQVNGIDKNEFKHETNLDVFERFPALKKHLETGLLTDVSGRIRLTRKGLDLANTVMRDLFGEE